MFAYMVWESFIVRDSFPGEHFCKVAAINHEVVDEKRRQMIEATK